MNKPPFTPVNVHPMEGDTIINTSISFEWYSKDHDSETMTYDLHFGESESPPIVVNDITGAKYTLSETKSGVYYWYVTAKDNNSSVDGPISFIRLVNPSEMPIVEYPVLMESIKGEAIVSSSSVSEDEILERGFVWSRRSMPDKKILVEGKDNIFTATLFELYDKTEYYVRSYVTVGQGTIYSEEMIFESWDDGIDSGTIIDPRDEESYDFVRIGSQKWMTRNLAYLPQVDHPSSESIEEPYYFVYDYFGDKKSEALFTDKYQTYGVLYNWPATIQDSDPSGWKVQGVCPVGWHVPNDEEWNILAEFLGGRTDAGGKLKEVGYEHWTSPNTGAKDLYGFRALPGGARGINDGAIDMQFQVLGTRTFWWSATELDLETAKRRYLYNEYSAMGDFSQRKSVGFSVRCLKD